MRNLCDLWAKSTGESIATHTLKVLDNLRQFRERSPNLSKLCISPGFWKRAGLAVCLHDLGKCCDGFQSVVHDDQRFPHRHEVLSALFIPWILDNGSEDAAWVAAAILTHHKDWSEIERLYPASDPYEDGPDGLEELSGQWSREFFLNAERIIRESIWPTFSLNWLVPEDWTEAVFQDWIPNNPARELRSVLDAVQGLMRRSRRLNSPAPEILEGTLIRGAIILADHSGSAWENFRVLPDLEDEGRVRNRLGLTNVENLYPHQAEVARHEGNAILIAPTGSGKTEAAILWSSRQASRMEGHPVLYYLLPYQASLNAMRQRLALQFGAGAVTLQHSRAVQAIYRQLLDKEYTSLDAQRIAKRERNLASLYVKPLRISTPYQLLKGAFQLKGHEALWTAAASALFILDEIHVYETGRLSILLATLQYLCLNLDGKALVMSATMPNYLTQLLAEILPGISVLRANRATLEKFCRHEIRLLEAGLTDKSITDAICRNAEQGMGILVVATTVGRAQEIWRNLVGQTRCRVELLHGRFHAEDRSEKEGRILATRGLGKRSKDGVILVATQVVEVSLNVDFDVLYSDPAPLEALLQRFGRVNRERLTAVRTVNVCRDMPDGSPVYSRAFVDKALQVLDPWNAKPLHEGHVQEMLDQIYSGKLGADLTAQLRDGIRKFSKEVLSSCRPFSSDERIEELFEAMFDGYEVLPRSLRVEYERRLEEEPLLAPGLLIPITRGQYFSLQCRGRLQRVDRTIIANCPYTEQGLEVYGPPSEDGV